MRLVGRERLGILEFAIHNQVHLAAQLIGLDVLADLEQRRMRNLGQQRQPLADRIEIAGIAGGSWPFLVKNLVR